MKRRQFTQATLGSLLTYSLLETLMTGDVFAADMKLLAGKWMKDLHELSEEVKGQKLKQTEWQTKVDELFAKVDLAEELKGTAFSVDIFQRWYIDHNRTKVSNSMFTLGEAGLPLEAHPLVEEADLLHLHSVSRFLSPASIARIAGMRSVAAGCDGDIGLIASRRTVPSRMYSWRSASRPGGCWSAGSAYSAATCSGDSSVPVPGSRIEYGPSTRSIPSRAVSSSL